MFATLQLLANNVFSYDMACAVGVPWMIGFAAIALVPAAFIFWFAYWWKDRKRAYLPRVAKVFLSLNVSFRFVHVVIAANLFVSFRFVSFFAQYFMVGMLGIVPVAAVEYAIMYGNGHIGEQTKKSKF